MNRTDSHDDPPPDSGPVFSSEAVTPRGGFMARPGLKPPPRHAVVVRGGDVPVEQAIPVARSSFPPPAPSEPEPVSMSEKVTLRLLPTPRVPRISSVVFDEPPRSPRAFEMRPAPLTLESSPPPSDEPLVQSVPPVSVGPRSRRKGAGWTVFVAGAAGVILGLASVLAARSARERPADSSSTPLAAAAAVAEPEDAVPASTIRVATTPPSPAPAARPSASAASPKPPVAAVKRSIF